MHDTLAESLGNPGLCVCLYRSIVDRRLNLGMPTIPPSYTPNDVDLARVMAKHVQSVASFVETD